MLRLLLLVGLISTLAWKHSPCDNEAMRALPFCNTSLSIERRALDFVHRIPRDQMAPLMVDQSPGLDKLHLDPYVWWNEALHGLGLSPGIKFQNPTPVATCFPQVIGLANAFNRALVRSIGSAIATEARAFYNQGHAGLTFWAPNINIYRDPRWGRGQETPGEDPVLTSAYAVAFVRGMQEGSSSSQDLVL